MPVLVRMHNCVEFAETVQALLKIGALPVLQNSLLGEEEVDYVIGHSDAAAAFALLSRPAEPERQACRDLTANSNIDGSARYDDLIAGAPDSSFPTADTASNDPAFFVYTSGTTGRPKGIVHAHRWVIALGDSNSYRLPPKQGDRSYATGEWSFISALGHNVFPLRNGVTGDLRDRPSPENVLRTIEDHKVTLMYSVATEGRILAISEVENEYDLSRCAAAMQPAKLSSRDLAGIQDHRLRHLGTLRARKCRWCWGRGRCNRWCPARSVYQYRGRMWPYSMTTTTKLPTAKSVTF